MNVEILMGLMLGLCTAAVSAMMGIAAAEFYEVRRQDERKTEQIQPDN